MLAPVSFAIAYIGNFGPPNSTENDLRTALTSLGHVVTTFQEEVESGWLALIDDPGLFDLILWTRTASLADRIGHQVQRRMQFAAHLAGVPTVGYHLDRWWGLKRQYDVLSEPFFQCDWVFTADGGHDPEFQAAGVNHRWAPPAISRPKAKRGAIREDYKFDVAFVGSWMGGYHDEWQHRPQMIDFLRNNYGSRLGLFPQRAGDPRIDGDDRADLYASAKVIVGDSCLVPLADGSPMVKYCSDRVFETVGQGGYLLHPFVGGVIEGPDEGGTISSTALLTAGVHLGAWTLWDWDGLGSMIEEALTNQLAIDLIRQAGFEEVRQKHTYKDRMRVMLNRVIQVAS